MWGGWPPIRILARSTYFGCCFNLDNPSSPWALFVTSTEVGWSQKNLISWAGRRQPVGMRGDKPAVQMEKKKKVDRGCNSERLETGAYPEALMSKQSQAGHHTWETTALSYLLRGEINFPSFDTPPGRLVFPWEHKACCSKGTHFKMHMEVASWECCVFNTAV